MSAEVNIREIYIAGESGSVLIGEVESGEVIEGEIGVTARGKRFTVVKIERDGMKVKKVAKGDKANISVKYLAKEDIRRGESIFFS